MSQPGEQHAADQLGIDVRFSAADRFRQQARQSRLHLGAQLVDVGAEPGNLVYSCARTRRLRLSFSRTSVGLVGCCEPLVGCTGKNYALAGGAAAPNAFAMMARGAALLVDGTGGAVSALCAPYAPRMVSAPAPDTRSYLLRPDTCVAWTSGDAA